MYNDCRNVVRLLSQTQVRLRNIKCQICRLYSLGCIKDALGNISNNFDIITVELISEYLVKNGIYYTNNEIVGFIQQELPDCFDILTVDMQSMFQNRFLNWLTKDVGQLKEEVSSSQKALLPLRLCQLLSLGIRQRTENTRQKEMFRRKYDLKKLFRELSDGKSNVKLKKVHEKLKLDEKQAQILWKYSEKGELTCSNFCQLFDFETSSRDESQSAADLVFNPQILHQTHFNSLTEYLSQVVKSIKRMEQIKQSIIQKHQEASSSTFFLLISSNLDSQLTFKQFLKKCQDLNINFSKSQIEQLFKRYSQSGLFSFQSSKKLFDPFDDAVLAVVKRRSLSKPTMKLLEDYCMFISKSIEVESLLQLRKIKSQNFGQLFMCLDMNRDTRVCREDLHRALGGRLKQTYTDYHRIIYRFTMSTDSKMITFQDFLREMMPR